MIKPNRQQKRKMLRDLNDPAKLKKMVERQENRNAREFEIIKNDKKRKLAVVVIAVLFVLIGAAIIFR